MYKSLKMLWGFFGELGHGADPRARKNLGRLPAMSLQRIEDEDEILNGALVLVLILDLDLDLDLALALALALVLALALDHGR
jgi:hypothetical protein